MIGYLLISSGSAMMATGALIQIVDSRGDVSFAAWALNARETFIHWNLNRRARSRGLPAITRFVPRYSRGVDLLALRQQRHG
jgi:hypothetical protein